MTSSNEIRVLLQLETFNYKLLIPKAFQDETNCFELTLAGVKHYLELNQPHVVAQGICVPYNYTFEIFDDDFKEYVVLTECHVITDMARIRVRPNSIHYAGQTKNGHADNGYSEPLTGHRRCRIRALSTEQPEKEFKPHVMYQQQNSQSNDSDQASSMDCSGISPAGGPMKRGPGRPRTRPLPDPTMPRRGPGRPRKDSYVGVNSNPMVGDSVRDSMSSLESSPVCQPPVKRGPGRPPKNQMLATYYQDGREILPPVSQLKPGSRTYMINGIDLHNLKREVEDHFDDNSPEAMHAIHPGHPDNHMTNGHLQHNSMHHMTNSIAAMQQLLNGNDNSGQLANDITVDSVRAEVTLQEGSGPSSVNTMVGSVSSEVSN